jgi:3',5'-cyclic-AMP phosphodiesterase
MKIINNQNISKKRKFIPSRKLFAFTTVFLLLTLTIICEKISAQAGASAGVRPSDSFSFVYFTDAHLDYKGNTIQYFNKAVKTINKLNPDFVITGGDNIKDATLTTEAVADSLFDLYISGIKKFKMDVHTGIGNHESFGTGKTVTDSMSPFYGKKMYESKIGLRYYVFSHRGWKFFMLDGIINTDSGHHYTGGIDDAQMNWIKSELAATDTLTPVVICSHIPIISSLKKFEFGSLSGTPENDGISNSIELFDLFSHHNLKLVLQGHFHFLEVLYTNDIYYITGPSLTARWGNIFTRKSGFLLFITNGDNLSWKFIDNYL